MSFTFATSGSNMVEAAGTTLDVTLTLTAGSLIVAWCKHEGTAAAFSVAKSDGTNTFTPATKTNHGNGDLSGQFHWIAGHAMSGSTTLRLTTASRQYRSLILFEYTYTGGSLSLDTETGATGNGTAVSSGNITTTGSDELVFGGYGEYFAAVANTPLVNGSAADRSILLNTPNYTASWVRAVGATFTGPVSITAGGSADWLCRALAFKITAAGGATVGVGLIDSLALSARRLVH